MGAYKPAAPGFPMAPGAGGPSQPDGYAAPGMPQQPAAYNAQPAPGYAPTAPGMPAQPGYPGQPQGIVRVRSRCINSTRLSAIQKLSEQIPLIILTDFLTLVSF
jgi:hypothetical protein